MAIVYVSHRLEEIFAITDRVTVMRDGQTVLAADTASVDRARLIAEITGERAAGRGAAPVRGAARRTSCCASRG